MHSVLGSLSSSFAVAPLRLKASTRRISSIAHHLSPVEMSLKAYVKAQPGTTKLGDCPFSQRMLLTLEEKKISYDLNPVDTADKPDWFLKLNPEGKVPVLDADGQILSDSALICDWLEDKYPEPKLAAPAELQEVGAGVFGAFVQFLKAGEGDPEGKEKALLEELGKLDSHVASKGPYVGGASVNATDLSLMPKLVHMTVALKAFKGWEAPKELAAVSKYLELTFARDSVKKTLPDPLEETIKAGWQRHVQG